MTNETNDRTHELLCAYVLGESNATERAEIEALLADSAELRAEKARIETTIGLVRTSLGKQDTLSPAAREEVLRAALPPIRQVHPWWRQSWVRAAAGILFCSLALGGWTVYDLSRRSKEDSEVARREVTRRSGLDGEPSGFLDAAGEFRKFGAPAESADDASKLGKHSLAGGLAAVDKEQDAFDAKGRGAAPEDSEVRSWDVPKRDELLARGDEASHYKESTAPVVRDFDVEIAGAAEVLPAVTGTTALGTSPGGTSAGPGDSVTEALFAEVELQVGRPAQAPAPQINVLSVTEAKSQSAAGNKPGELARKVDDTRLRSERGSAVESQSGGGGGGSLAGLGYDGAGVVNLPPATKMPAEPELRTRIQAGNPGAPATGGVAPTSAPTGLDLVVFEQEKNSAPGAVESRQLSKDLHEGSSLEPGHFAFRSGGGLVAGSPVQEQLSDEDRFVLERLGIEPARWHEHPVTPDQRNRFRGEYVDHWCKRVVVDCRRRPDEKPRDMFFRFWGDNPFEFAAVDSLSTFSADVDTASYALARRYIESGQLPEKAQIRTEEFVNYFKADVPAPTKGTFAVHTTLAPSRFGAAAPGEFVKGERDMLRVVVRGKDVPKAERKPLALTFVVDCSGSMKEQNRIEMVKHAMRLLVTQLDARDSIAIVKFSTDAALVLPMTSCKDKALIESAIQPLVADGSTNSEAGLRMGYGAALAGLNREATNRVVFLSDGVANVGVTDPNVISDSVKPIREQGIYLNTVGVGMNNHNDVLLEQLADKSDGVCNYVDNELEAKKVFVDDFMGTVETIARDVKIQVEFDPAQVYRYRLLGYENRAVADVDFRNDKVDAGEIGAGHQVTALYEIEYADPKPNAEKPLATVRVRFKAPRKPGEPTANEEASELALPVKYGQRTSWEGAGTGYRRALLAGQFAEFLRRSVNARSDSYEQMLSDARKLAAEGADAEFQKLVTLMEQAKTLILNGWPTPSDPIELAVDGLRQNGYRCELALLEKNQDLLNTLERHNRELEQQLRDTLRQRLEQPR